MSEVSVSETPRRSPAYPALSLRAAIERAKVLYAAERQHIAPIETAVKHWGYKGPSGATNIVISALKKYGLIVDSGSGRARKIQVTDLAVRILEHPQELERLASIQRAALLPPIHAEMWRKYRLDMPSDDSWIWELKEDRDFTDGGARDFVKEYRDTVRFAQLGADEANDPELSEPEDEASASNGDGDFPLDPPDQPRYRFPDEQARQIADFQTNSFVAQAKVQTYPIPVSATGKPPVTVSGAFPLTTIEWTQFMAVLNAMKPVLMSDPALAAADPTDDDPGF